ncbi:hypothetical protein H5410_012543 [Solanum commersonii]|uniref:Uncharacterized protein n=1 Tax=Solanum commersonii TaxID=4109 RepID=A0A9J6ARX3_SOLCO|nr:hypothetical protein H5410_012540 [Solanum commersonii]KAG5627325.1 hypothetical protein H5410_012543 [Solanum commersonii]
MYHFCPGCCDILMKYTLIVSPLLIPLLYFCAITREKRKRNTWYSVAVLVNNENIRCLYCKTVLFSYKCFHGLMYWSCLSEISHH